MISRVTGQVGSMQSHSPDSGFPASESFLAERLLERRRYVTIPAFRSVQNTTNCGVLNDYSVQSPWSGGIAYPCCELLYRVEGKRRYSLHILLFRIGCWWGLVLMDHGTYRGGNKGYGA